MTIAKTKRQFGRVAQADVPHGRNGRHKQIVSAILAELDDLKAGDALKISLVDLKDSKAKIRSALNRVSHKLNRPLATAADAQFLYVWDSAIQNGRER